MEASPIQMEQKTPISPQMERIPREQQHLGTHRTIACPTIVKGIPFPSPTGSYKNPTDPTSNSFPSSPLIPHSKLEFHPYTYLNFHVLSSFPNTPCMSMSDFSVNPSNESPTSTPPHLPMLPIPFNPSVKKNLFYFHLFLSYPQNKKNKM